MLKIGNPADPMGGDQITIENWEWSGWTYYRIERVEFADGTVWTSSDLTNMAMVGTDNGETINLWKDGTWVDGKGGNDTIVSGATSATVYGGSGNDTITDSDGSDTIDGGAGDDTITDSGTGTNVLRGGDGNDRITFSYQANNTIEGGAGDDLMQIDGLYYTATPSYANTFAGGAGNDRINGGSSADTYLFNRGDGQDTINDYGNGYNKTDRIILGAGIGVGDVTVSRSEGNLVLKIGNPADPMGGDQITIENWEWSGWTYYRIERVEFADGTVLSGDQVSRMADGIRGTGAEDILLGTAADDVIYGDEGGDVLDGGDGADILFGGTGDDNYVVDNAGDMSIEKAGEGVDSVQASVNYLLSENVENLLLIGELAIDGEGNPLANTLTGNSANNVLAGGGGDDTLDGREGTDTLIGGIGDDTYFVDNGGDIVIENADEGADTVHASISYALSADIENLVLTGTATIDGIGNDLDNVLTGNAAANVLDGGIGADVMNGGAGADTYYVDNAGDVVVDYNDGSWDVVYASVSYTLQNYTNELRLTGPGNINGTGDGGHNYLYGNAGNNVLAGNAGNDHLYGGDGADTLNGGAGTDVMVGGFGNDIYYVDNVDDVVTELTGEGIDRVVSSISYTLGADVENLTLSGVAAVNGTGNALDNSMTGNAADNLLDGGAGNDNLNGADGNDTLLGGDGGDTLNGADGADAMYGGTGDDIYYVDNTADVVVELVGEGSDTVQSSISTTLAANVENLVLTGAAAIHGTGNDLDNVLTGNEAANVLDGGIGADVMNGGAGADTYYVDNAGDVVVDDNDGSWDVVYASISYTLQNYTNELRLTGLGDINGTGDGGHNYLYGNAGNNVLAGNAGNDHLYGGDGADTLNGGAGTDVMVGGFGNDIYYVDNVDDVVTELTGEGTDRVVSSISYTLGADVENLTLSGVAAINGTGNAIDNSMAGNGADNLLNGGDGNDSMNGAAGQDFLEGMDGNDTLTDTAGSGYFSGGAGADRLTGSAGADFFVGGTGNDILATGGGKDLIAFNRGDGYDTVSFGAAAQATVSLGGGIAYEDIRLKKSGNDLVLDAGNGEGMVFKNWYAATPVRGVANLQVMAEAMAGFDETSADPLLNAKVQDFDFQGLADAFDAARATTPGLTSWALSSALIQFHLSSSDNVALGGDLAYQYGRNGSLAGLGLMAAQEVMGDAAFGNQAQALRPLAGLQEGAVRLS
ncbi:MAG: hypothetical protein OEL88_09995 [Sterolibacteriaceae bacterium MAG5]|nr:hypothetical protein [Candidatus Nitricoxidireducens bremensis]